MTDSPITATIARVKDRLATMAYQAEEATDIRMLAAALEKPRDASGDDGYKSAFYEIADMLDIPARTVSAAQVWADEMRPRLLAALAPSDPVADETRAREVFAQAFERAGDQHAADCIREAPTKAAARQCYALPLHYDVTIAAMLAFARETSTNAACGKRDGETAEDGEARYLIRKGGAYYRKNSQGYTHHREASGRYSLEEAIAITHPNGPDGPRDGMDYVLDTAASPNAASTAAGHVVRALKEAREQAFRAGYQRVLDFARLGVVASDFERDVGAYMADFIGGRP